ncbi:unnamed protein product [Brachionus calyciflorus]|uniref:Uncharacterized protein n=1 Tax=Brachionus calyciflorus TaxID=104777 RepID=A0A813W9G3_9BILA|nr:unnamed protein product [Brachionus calyciflorus]
MNKIKLSAGNIHSPYRTRSGKVRQTQTQFVSVDDSSIVEDQVQLTSFSRSESMQSLSHFDQNFSIETCNENEINKDKEDATINNTLCDEDEEKNIEKNDHRTVDHNHEPDPIKEEVYVYTTKILARAFLTNEDTRTIIKECLIGISSFASCKIPRVPALTQRIQRFRIKKSDHGKNPENLE